MACLSHTLIFALYPVQGAMVTAEDARGWTALHYACRTIAQSERSDSAADLSLDKERAEEVRLVLQAGGGLTFSLVSPLTSSRRRLKADFEIERSFTTTSNPI